MRRIVSVWFPEFPVERFIRAQTKRKLPPPARDGQPFVLAESGAKGLRLVACNGPARALGLHRGQRLADARAMAPGLLSEIHEPHKDAESLLGLARWAERYTPLAALDPPDGLLLDIAGVAHLFGGEPALLEDLRRRLARHGFTASPAAAPTIGAAWALARFSQDEKHLQSDVIAGLVPATHGAARTILFSRGTMGPWDKPKDDRLEEPDLQALAPLPVEALRIAADAALILRRLGLKTIGDLFVLPRASLARRFRGETIPDNVLLRLDEALGARDEPLSPLTPPPDFSVRLGLMEPLISAEGLEAALPRLVEKLASVLAQAGQGATRLALRLYRSDGSRLSLPVGLTAPSHDAVHLLRLLRPRLEAADAGFGIDALVLEARETAALAERQAGFMEEAQSTSFASLADRVMNRHDGVLLATPQPVASHIPERAERLEPSSMDIFDPSPPRKHGGEGSKTKHYRLPEREGERARPLLILDRPEPATVIAKVPDGPPVRFTWRRVSHRVVRAAGPERIAPEWWRLHLPDARPRDYYLIEDAQGRRYWLYREGLYGEDGAAPKWFVHGLSA